MARQAAKPTGARGELKALEISTRWLDDLDDKAQVRVLTWVDTLVDGAVTDDKELKAMAAISRAFGDLEQPARESTVRWLNEHYTDGDETPVEA